MANKNILLIEPGYKNKYPPLGLMKIAQYHGPRGKRDRVRFIKGEDRSVLNEAWDRIYVTTLFSFEYPKISQTIDFAIEVANGQADKVFVGGIAASLMHERFLDEKRWHGIRFIKGLLSEAPAVSLQLDEFSEELYASDTTASRLKIWCPTTTSCPRSTTNTPSATRISLILHAAASANATSAACPNSRECSATLNLSRILSGPSKSIMARKRSHPDGQQRCSLATFQGDHCRNP
ncbi:Radical SAM domain protein [Agrobacterium tumefaciens]|nr:Radical SAM domain protein [Agrobacterium tumefaciens]